VLVVNLYLERCLTRREELRADAETILTVAAQENRDVTDPERASVEGMYREIKDLDDRIEPLHQAEMRNANHERTVADLERTVAQRRNEPTPSGQLERYRGNVGGWLADWGAQRSDPHAAQRIARAHAEWRVVADQKLVDNPGIIPVPVVGDIVGTLSTARPLIDSVVKRALPAGGSTFNRPTITQHAAVGLQATEKTQLASQKMVIGSIPVTKQTYGGTLDISFQDRDWTDPAILAIAVADLAGLYAKETDNAAADGLTTATTGTFVLASGAAEGVIRSAFMTAASAIFSAVGSRPDTVWMSPDEYAWIAATTSPNGGPAFPGMGDLLGAGANIMGLRVVVDGNLAPATTIIGVSTFVEHYETVGGLLSVTEPTILGYTIAYYGYVADLLVNVGATKKRSATE
jgi:HK97 family phage major capsid protein